MLYDICKLLLQDWSEDGLQFVPWPLEQCLSGHPPSGCSLLEPSCHAVGVHGTEKPHAGPLVNSLAELPARASKRYLAAAERQPPQKQLPRQAPWEFLI